MPPHARDDPFVFLVETHFQRMAQRSGGVPRKKAIEIAQTKLDELRPDFHKWLDDKLLELTRVIDGAKSNSMQDSSWIDVADLHSRALRDVGATFGFELISFIANNLCEMLEAGPVGIDQRLEAIECHVKALVLARQERYRDLRPDDIPDLTDGLRRLAMTAPHSRSKTARGRPV